MKSNQKKEQELKNKIAQLEQEKKELGTDITYMRCIMYLTFAKLDKVDIVEIVEELKDEFIKVVEAQKNTEVVL